MKIFCAGAEGPTNQIDRIRSGFLLHGHDIVQDYLAADIIYCNDPSCYLDYEGLKYSKALVIYNVLDIPPHCMDPNRYDVSRYPKVNVPWERDFSPEELKEKLKGAHIVTCISSEVQYQLYFYCGISAHVIYNPIKDVSFDRFHKFVRNGNEDTFLYVGRALDPNKRFRLVVELFQKLGIPQNRLIVVGQENPGFGRYGGVVDDDTLSHLYNDVDFVFMPSAFEGLGLPAIEATVCNTIPIVTNDNPTAMEFFSDIALPPNELERFLDWNWRVRATNFVDKYSDIFAAQFNKMSIVKNILKLY